MKKVISETEYLELSNGVLLEQHNELVVLDITLEKVYAHNIFNGDS